MNFLNNPKYLILSLICVVMGAVIAGAETGAPETLRTFILIGFIFCGSGFLYKSTKKPLNPCNVTED